MAAASFAVMGHAAGIGASSQSLGASSVSVGACDSDGVSLTPNLSGGNIVSVTVAGIASACEAGSLSLTFDNGAANSGGTGTVPAGGGSLTITLGTAVALDDAGEADVTIAGP
jgi:hypothetical protein